MGSLHFQLDAQALAAELFCLKSVFFFKNKMATVTA
jgi:hypothetical protein